MKKVTQAASRAFINGVSFKSGNTSVEIHGLTNRLFLFGNNIATMTVNTGQVQVNFCGWSTPTTKERINGLCEMLGKRDHFHIVAGQLQNNGVEVDNDGWIEL